MFPFDDVIMGIVNTEFQKEMSYFWSNCNLPPTTLRSGFNHLAKDYALLRKIIDVGSETTSLISHTICYFSEMNSVPSISVFANVWGCVYVIS